MTPKKKYENVDTIQSIVQEELKAAGSPALRKFAAWLTESLSKNDQNTLSHASIINWRDNGKFPNTDFLEGMLVAYAPEDRRYHFALRCLAVKAPLVWGPEGIVWRLPRAG